MSRSDEWHLRERAAHIATMHKAHSVTARLREALESSGSDFNRNKPNECETLGFFSLFPSNIYYILCSETACRLLPPFKYNCTLSVNLSLNSVQFQGPAVNVTAGRNTERRECENKTTGRSELKGERQETGTGGEIEQQVIVKQTKRVANGLSLPPHLPQCETFGEY